MRICFLGDFYSVHTYRWAKFFSDRHEVHLISLEALSTEPYSITLQDYYEIGIKTHIVPRKRLNKLLAIGRIRNLMRSIRPDIVHAHYITHYGYLGAKSGIHPLVITAWGTDVLIESHQRPIKSHQIRYALSKADIVTCDGENTAKALQNLIGDDRKIKRIYFGVDTKNLSPEKRDTKFYDAFKKGAAAKVVINLRGFADIYDPGTFIGAIPAVLARYPETIFVMARENEKRKIFEQMAKSFGVSHAVKFIGNITPDRLPDYLASSDIYVSTSLSDSGLSASTAEAMACGLPIISTDVGDISYWIEDGRNGFIIPKGDSRALSQKLLLLLDDEDRRISMGREARKTIEARQDYHKEMGRAEQLYEQLIMEMRK